MTSGPEAQDRPADEVSGDGPAAGAEPERHRYGVALLYLVAWSLTAVIATLPVAFTLGSLLDDGSSPTGTYNSAGEYVDDNSAFYLTWGLTGVALVVVPALVGVVCASGRGGATPSHRLAFGIGCAAYTCLVMALVAGTGALGALG